MAIQTSLTPEEVASLLMVSPVKVYDWLQRGMLHATLLPPMSSTVSTASTRDDRRFDLGDIQTFARERGMLMGSPEHGKLRVLIIDDDVQMARYLVELFDTFTETVEAMAVHSGFEAGRMLDRFTPDIVLLDLMMPQQDSFEICRRIKSDPATQRVRVIAISSHADEGHRQRIAMAGAEVCLHKPFKGQALFDAMGLCKAPVVPAEHAI
ncbi:MAG: response regulator [Gammaproteobacteria bacterium]|nr:response regulator [Gammaproteobacteria bacterium]